MKLPVLKAPLSQEIQREYEKLINFVSSTLVSSRMLKQIEGIGGKVRKHHFHDPNGQDQAFVGWFYSCLISSKKSIKQEI